MGILLDNMNRAGRAEVWSENEEEWMKILKAGKAQQVADILEAETDEAQRLRSNFRGFHILPEWQRRSIIQSGYGLQPFSETLIHAA
jgi:hypothetical protein